MTQLTLAPLSNFDIGVVAAVAIALTAYRTRSLSATGALAAIAVGTATFGALAFPGAFVLLTFFISSLGFSRIGRERKRELLIDVGKTSARDGTQVLANGGVAAVCALLALWVDARYAIAFAGAFAAATADTWGTEIGALSRSGPRSILTLRPIAIGLSGGVTVLGTLAEVAGAATIGVVAFGLTPHLATVAAVAAGGVGGALLDSILGASLQSLRWCGQCRRATEREPHACGANTTPLRGLQWFGNDAVNFAATAAGAAIAVALAR
ncbi:MAG: DUF92 domain-containing protein [Candidatus Eremiobacteraeota bacterium]|nr:DUF92 domain-containing protein [Candidatus Eremiobacteraeota bacterium]